MASRVWGPPTRARPSPELAVAPLERRLQPLLLRDASELPHTRSKVARASFSAASRWIARAPMLELLAIFGMDHFIESIAAFAEGRELTFKGR